MRLNIVCFALGVWLLQRQAELPAPPAIWLGAAAAAGALWLPRQFPLPEPVRALFATAACGVLGFCWAAACAQWRMADALPPEWEGRDIVLTGVVAGLPQPYQRSVRFEFDVEAVHTPGASVPPRILLAWWGRAARENSPTTFAAVRAGERWLLTVRLRRPRGGANPHGFDYEAWLFERGIRATGYVRTISDARKLADRVDRPRYWIAAARERLRSRILAALPQRPYAGVIAALAIGDQRAIPPGQWQVFTRTGVNHLMSISGLHVTMVSGLVFALAYWVWRRSARLVLKLPARKAAAAAGLAAAFVYTLLAGFGVPAQRTLYMLAVAAAALWRGRITSVSTVLAAALFTVLLLDPWAVLTPGFWLSFGAVAVIMWATSRRIAQPHWLPGWLKVQWAVTVALVPPLIALFQQVSLVSPLANAIAIPVVSLAVVPLTLIGAVLPVDFVLQLAQQIMAWCGALLEALSALPAAVWQQHAPPPWAVAAAAAGAFWLLLPRGFPTRWLGAVLFAPLALTAGPRLGEGELRVTVLDVGHGLAVAAVTRNHALLYDSGPAFGPGADSGNRIIVPFLRAAGVKALAGMIVSHDDIDHSGGAVSVLQALPVGWLASSLPDTDPPPFEATHAYRCYAGQRWEWDGVAFEILHPQPASYDEPRFRDNDRSCVLKIAARWGGVLLPADIERKSERELVARAAERLRADVLIAPHQGSRTSSTADFVAAVAPRAVIFPVGYRNRFGHPHAEVVERYQALGSHIYRTDRDGAVTVIFSAPGTIRIEPHRARYRRYWQTPLADAAVAGAAEM
jgi:competence protein ComEC